MSTPAMPPLPPEMGPWPAATTQRKRPARSVAFIVLLGLGIAFLWMAVPLVALSAMGDCGTASVECGPDLGARRLMYLIILGVPLVTTMIGVLAALAGRTAALALLLAASLFTVGTCWVTVARPGLAGEWPALPALFFFFAPGALLIAVGCAWQIIRQRR